MRSQLLLQPYADEKSLYDVLVEGLSSSAFESFTAVVAWARMSGLSRMSDLLAEFRSRGGHARILLGIDEAGATQDGLTAAHQLFDEAWVVHDRRGGTFHPKMYYFRGRHQSMVVIGSNNLTAGGLYFNYETAHLATLDLSLPMDAALGVRVDDYIIRILDDNTSRLLDPEFIQLLVNDPRYAIPREQERRRPSTGSAEDSAQPDQQPPAENLFGNSKYPHKASPSVRRRTVGDVPSSSHPTPATGRANVLAEAGGSAAPVVGRWTKRLTRSDCGRPRPGSNTTNALRFTQHRHPIDQGTWFRTVLFRDADWRDDPDRPGRERTSIRFEVIIDGANRGTHVLSLKYDARREAGQDNFTTDLKWGSLSPVLAATDLVGECVSVERLADGSFRLIIAPQPAGEFLDPGVELRT